MSELRRWMRLCETSTQTVRVFHGSDEPHLTLRPESMYGVRDFGFAASYPFGRSYSKRGWVHTLDFHFSKLADNAIIEQIADDLGIELGTGVVLLADRNHPDDSPEYRALHEKLVALGYNGITGYDFGFRSDFEELPVWVVFDAAKQVTIIDTVEVTRADIPRKHPRS